MGFWKKIGKIASIAGPFLSLLGPVGGLMGAASGIGGVLSKISPVTNGLGSLLSVGGSMSSVASQNRSQKEMMNSLMEERTLANQAREREQTEIGRKKKQLTDLRRSVGSGRRSLLSAWYDDGALKQTVGA